jgi:hypothetical protein
VGRARPVGPLRQNGTGGAARDSGPAGAIGVVVTGRPGEWAHRGLC